MSRISLVCAFALTSLFSMAAFASGAVPAKVIKSKEGRAIIKVPSDVLLDKGLYRLVPARSGGGSIGSDSRDNLLGGSIDVQMLTVKTEVDGNSVDDTSKQNFRMDFFYGWNFGYFEAGPRIEYNFVTTQAGSADPVDTSTILFGGLFDLNFMPNTTDSDMVLGLRLAFGFGSADSSAVDEATSVMDITPGLILKWFGLSDSVAVTGLVGYKLRTDSVAETKTTTSGLLIKLGIQTYF
jgi:hypothetical protein